MAHDSIFRIFSMTKPIVSVGIMMLVEDGHFILGDPVAKFIPEFAEQKVGKFRDEFCDGIAEQEWPSSTSIMMPTETIGLVIEKMRKMVSCAIGAAPPGSGGRSHRTSRSGRGAPPSRSRRGGFPCRPRA